MKEVLQAIRNFKWVFNPLDVKSKVKLIIALLLIIGSSIIVSLIPKYIGKIIDIVITNSSLAYNIIGLITILFVIDIIFEVIRKYLIESTATKAQKELIINTSDRLIKLDLGWISAQRTGGLNGRIQRSVEGSIKLLKLMCMDFAPNIFQMVFAVSVAIITNLYIGIILILVIIIGLFVVQKQIKSQKGIRISLLRAREENDSNIVELLSGIESVRVANEENNQIKRIEVVNETLRATELKHHIKMMTFDSIKKVNIVFWNILILLLGVILVSKNLITPGEIVIFNLLFNTVVNPLQNIHRFIDEAQEASLKNSDLREILSIEIDRSFNLNVSNNDKIKETEFAITLQNINFTYDDREILKDVNVNFEKGKYYGLIGSTGCGKSTLLRLIMNLIHPNSGTINVFGKRISEITRESLSSMITFMPQTPFIFSGTIRQNLLFGSKMGIDDSELFWALEQVCLRDDIIHLDNQLDFVLNERGNNISGGQKQRIALARIFLNIRFSKLEKILILDEATSALDIQTEETIINNLLSIINDKTTIIAIAHRYSTLKKSDMIIVLENGSVKKKIDYSQLTSLKQVEYSVH